MFVDLGGTFETQYNTNQTVEKTRKIVCGHIQRLGPFERVPQQYSLLSNFTRLNGFFSLNSLYLTCLTRLCTSETFQRETYANHYNVLPSTMLVQQKCLYY